MAQAWANLHKFQHNKNRTTSGENMHYWSATYEIPTNEFLNQTSFSWWNELYKFGGISTSNVTYDRDLPYGHWSQMAWGNTQFVGCGMSRFTNESKPGWTYDLIFCNYYPPGNVINAPIYEIGEPCKNDGECTTLPNSTCDTEMGLCYAH